MTRQVNFNGYIQRLIPMLLIWGTMVHEYGHLIALRLMGLTGEIRSTGLNLTWLINGATDEQIYIWCMAGGLLQAVYGVSSMLYESDNETWLSGFTVACQGLTYMWWEYPRLIELGALFSIIVTMFAVIYLQLTKVISFE